MIKLSGDTERFEILFEGDLKMNKLLKAATLAALLGSSITAYATGSDVETVGGAINFIGSIEDSACSVNQNDVNKLVVLGNAQTSDMNRHG